MNKLVYKRNSVATAMIFLFIIGVIGYIISSRIAVYSGFGLSIISAIFVLHLTYKISKEVIIWA